MHVNGGSEDNNNYLIDGITVADYAFGELTYTPLPSPDAIQEFKVSTSLYDATQGRNGGGNINATLKSGTSKFHGDLWEYFRNTVLDANDYFLGKVVVKQNIFGGDIGGPIGPGAKFGFFYFNLQGTRQRSGDSPGTFINIPGSPGIPYVPLADRAVDRPHWRPTCGVPAANVDPVAFNLLNVKEQSVRRGWLEDTCIRCSPNVPVNTPCLHSQNHLSLPIPGSSPTTSSRRTGIANFAEAKTICPSASSGPIPIPSSPSAPILSASRPEGSRVQTI